MMTKKVRRLRRAILRSLRKQGYKVQNGLIRASRPRDKNAIRKLHGLAASHRIEDAEQTIRQKENQLIRFIANGSEVQPERIAPRLQLVESGTEHGSLFRYASLHWSVPVSNGYGRRLRFLVFDDQNDKLIGLIGLGDPVYSLRDRDGWIGWNADQKSERLYHVMDAYVLGAVPPYSMLLGGKLIAMITACNEVRRAFKRKYFGTKSIINKTRRPPYLTLITTTSALGKSSMYNRMKIGGFEYWRSIGFTRGFGEFHFSNGIYGAIREFAEDRCDPTAKQEAWGSGFRNKREVIRKCLIKLDLSSDLLNHGIEREVFAAPLGCKSLPFLRGETARPGLFNWPLRLMVDHCMDRWILPRATRRPDFTTFERSQYRLWT